MSAIPERFTRAAARFAPDRRRALRQFVRTSSRFGDLMISFPAAAHALAGADVPLAARAEAVRRVKDGAPLAAIAESLSLPLWLRKAPPEAFDGPIPRLPRDLVFERRIVNLMPDEPRRVAAWLRMTALGAAAAGPAFAVWLAQPRVYAGSARKLSADAVGLLAAFAWHGYEAAPNAPAARAIPRRWEPQMSFRAAATAAATWVRSVIRQQGVLIESFDGGWFKPTTVAGLRVVPRLTAEELAQEGDEMRNCVREYLPRVIRRDCLIYGLRRRRRGLATMEVVADRRLAGGARIAQLRGPHNAPAAEKAERAAAAWLAKRRSCPLPGVVGGLVGEIELARWEALWTPYRKAVDAHALRLLAPIGDAAAERALPGALSRALAPLDAAL